MNEKDFSAEDMEQETGYFANQAQSEFQRIIQREKYNQRRGKILFLRQIGREGRLKLKSKHGKRWQDAV